MYAFSQSGHMCSFVSPVAPQKMHLPGPSRRGPRTTIPVGTSGMSGKLVEIDAPHACGLLGGIRKWNEKTWHRRCSVVGVATPGGANGGAGASPLRHTTSAVPFAPNKRPRLGAGQARPCSRGVSGFFTGPLFSFRDRPSKALILPRYTEWYQNCLILPSCSVGDNQ